MKRMDAEETRRFWERANREARATPMEEASMRGSHSGRDRFDGECDVERMKQLLEQEPSLLDTVGQAIVNTSMVNKELLPITMASEAARQLWRYGRRVLVVGLPAMPNSP